MRLVIFHYHLLPGGVTGVIEQMAEALDRFSTTVDAVQVVTGSGENAETLRGRLPVEVVPEIGYTSRQRVADLAPATAGSPESDGPIGQASAAAVRAGADELTGRIARTLYERFGDPDSVWWIHNHHLGKNPAFTRALFRIAENHPEQRMVFHIHDFPECGRYSNLRFLHQSGATTLYPVLPNVRYATINSRDRNILVDAGVPAVDYLPNPVRTANGDTGQPGSERAAARDPAETRRILADHFGRDYPRFDPSHRMLLYPVRTIRRKNVFEAGLVAMALSEPASLVVTLPGVSQAEKQYSQMVQHAFVDGTIGGLWGIGTGIEEAGLRFLDVQHAADAIISSSVQEGFGFQFISPLLLGKGLVARHLDVLSDVEPLFRDWPHAFYRSIVVPNSSPSLSGPQALLRFRYAERIDRLAAHLPEETIHDLHRRVNDMVEADAIDFSFLLPHMQFTYLKDMRADTGFLRAVRVLNEDVFRLIEGALGQPPAAVHEGVEDRFGLSSFAAAVDRILTAPVSTGTEPAQTGPTTDDHVLRSFATLDYQRLLYE